MNWIGIALLYLLGMGSFMWLGGIASAADALSRWGRASAERRREDHGHEEALPDSQPRPVVGDEQREDRAVDDRRSDQQALRDRDAGECFPG